MKTRKLQSVGTALLLMLFLCTNLLWAENQEITRKKEYSQSFAARPDNNLFLSSKYGNITITHWKKDEVAFRVVVESKARNEQQAQRILERVQIILKKEDKTIMGLTEVCSITEFNNANFSINYYISMPSWMTTNIEQKYGNIQMPELNKGLCSIEIKYGNLEAGNFTQPLQLNAKYSNVTLGYLAGGNLDLAYSGSASVDGADELTIDRKYSNHQVNKIGDLTIKNKYGQLRIKEVNTLNASIKYSEVKIDYLERKLDCESLDYSNIDITKADAKFDYIAVDSQYGNLYVGLPASASFKVKADDIAYGDCDVSRRFKDTHREKHDDSDYYEINNGRNGRIEFDGGGYGKLVIGVSE